MEPDIVKEIVDRLIGNISPRGESNRDKESLENLKNYCDVIEKMIRRIDDIAYYNRDAREFSVKEHVDYINKFMTSNLGIQE